MPIHVRRKDKEITDPFTLKRILAKAKYLTIALCKNDEPYLVTLSYGYDEDKNCLFFHCAQEGKKLDFMKTNSKVWGQAILDYGYQEPDCDHHYASVHFKGRVSIINDIDDKRAAIDCMIRRLNKNPEPLIAKLKTERLHNTVLGRIDVEYMTGKKTPNINV
jgi:nitroimidazol reductase NimA-like FMN-containing flavoprotein (pyridoxamine 5'-phosphate oxidase superfamily)